MNEIPYDTKKQVIYGDDRNQVLPAMSWLDGLLFADQPLLHWSYHLPAEVSHSG